MKLSELITTKKISCTKCFSILYALPYRVDKSIIQYLIHFGIPIYPIGASSLLKIEASDGFVIESRIDTKVIKISMPIKYKDIPDNKITNKVKFEECLSKWLSEKLSIKIG